MTSSETALCRELYLGLLKKCLTRYGMGEERHVFVPATSYRYQLMLAPIHRFLAALNLQLTRRSTGATHARAQGLDWPTFGETMIGLTRLDHLQRCVTDIIEKRIPGDLLEAGVWRGGASIFMRAVLRAYGDTARIVWVADSFQGLPKPDAHAYPMDRGSRWWKHQELAVPLEEVKANFARYGMLDEQVRFLPGWFKDTLPSAPVTQLALLRVDGDMYESTIQTLEALYPKLAPGGYCIIDDYGNVAACRAAVEDFRRQQGIVHELQDIDGNGKFWQRGTDV